MKKELKKKVLKRNGIKRKKIRTLNKNKKTPYATCKHLNPFSHFRK